MKILRLFLLACIMALPCLNDAFAQKSISNYLPVDQKTYCKRTFEWTFGKTGLWRGEIIGKITVPYTSGPLSGSLGCNLFPGDHSLSVFDDEGRNLMDSSHYPSTDCLLTAYPLVALQDLVEEGLFFDFRSVEEGCGVFKGLDECLEGGGDWDDAWWFRFQDVTVQGRFYKNSLIIWNFDVPSLGIPLYFTFTGKHLSGKGFIDLD